MSCLQFANAKAYEICTEYNAKHVQYKKHHNTILVCSDASNRLIALSRFMSRPRSLCS